MSLTPYLLGVGQIQLGRQVDDLQLHDVLLCREGLGHFSQDIRCNLGHMLTVLSNEPEDAGSGHGHLCIWIGVRTGRDTLMWVGWTTKEMAARAGLLSYGCLRMEAEGRTDYKVGLS